MLKEFRRDLHRIPELDWQLPKTAAYLRRVLEALPCKVFSPHGDAVCAYFDFGFHETVAFRSDMDALPISEQTGLPFASEHPGQMHACGHDGHMAIVLGLALRLSNGELQPTRNVLLIFQPAEETTGGARILCNTGLLEEYRVCRIYGLHLWPGLEAGSVAACAGPIMARSCELTVDITGKSVHIAEWQMGDDAMLAAAYFLREAYKKAPQSDCLLRFGRMSAGTARNALSAGAHLEGSVRSMHDLSIRYLLEDLKVISEKIQKKTGCTFTFRRNKGYPPVINSTALVQEAAQRYPIENCRPSYLTDDFSFYQERVAGVYFRLGTGGAALHTPEFNFDEAVLEKGLALFSTLV